MNVRMKALLIVVFTLLSGAVLAAPSALVFTAIPDQDESQLQKRFSQVSAYLEKALGVPVTYLPVKSYGAAVTAFSHDQVQLAWFGGLSGVRARTRVAGSEAIAQGYEDQFFKTYFIVNTEQTVLDGPIDNLKPLQGLTFTFGSKGSTSGRLMPEYYLQKQFGLPPKKIFSRTGFSGDHSRTIALVESGAFNVGAVNFKVWESAVKEGKVDTSRVRVVWETPAYPDYQWSIRGDVDQRFGTGFTQKVQAALLEMKSEALLNAFPRQSFVKASNADYQPIVDVAKSIGLID